MNNNYRKTNRKGITPIIAIVLLLMMTVGAFGLTAMWVAETQTEIQEGISKDITSVTDKNAAQFNIESIYNHTSGDVSIILRNSGRYAFDDLSKFSLYLDGKGINNPIIVKTAFAVGDTITLNTDTKWDDIDDKVHTFKMVSPLSTQAIFTCVTSKTVNGYC